MTIPPSIQYQSEEIAEMHFHSSGERRVNIFGGVGFGKTTLLRALEDELASRGRKPVLVAPTPAEIDTGSQALIQICDGLAQHGMAHGEVAFVKDPCLHFQKKVDLVGRLLGKQATEVVLLCDEPNEWAIRSKSDQLYYVGSNGQTRSLVRELCEQFRCSKVIAERYWDQESKFPYHRLAFASDIGEALKLPDFQSELDSILQVSRSICENKSYLHLKLLAALQAAGGDPLSRQWEKDSLLARFFVRFMIDLKLPDVMLKVVARLALVRGEIEEDLLNELGFKDPAVSPLEKRLIRHGFLDEAHCGHFVMHPLLRQAVEQASILSYKETSEAHTTIASFQAKRLQSLREANRAALMAEYRGYDHSAKAGFASIERFSHFFVSQLHVWGRCLSRDLKQHGQATEVFRRAIQEDPGDDYGHHYLAYNLDYIAVDELRAEQHYRKAVELNFFHPWYWSRWINFLITTGRMADARKEWSIAGNALSVPENCDDETYGHLHLWVAQLLLHRAQLDFAQQVLDEVPERIRRTEVLFLELYQLLESLKIARDERAVFPAYIDPKDYWSEYPHLRQPLQWKQRGLTQFAPARVEAVSNDLVVLVAGKRDDGETRYGRLELPKTKFDESSVGFTADALSEGRYLELCFYGSDGLLRIDAYPVERPVTSMLPPLDPPNPNRYLEGWNPRK